MHRAKRLATAGVCAAFAMMSTVNPASAQELTTWLFAEGSTSSVLGFENELLIANPNTGDVVVTIAAFTQDGEAIAPFTLMVGPLSRAGVNVRCLPGVGDRAGLALRVTATDGQVIEDTIAGGVQAQKTVTGTKQFE